ncbi:SDR family NAD(P)-dependent oxidoreductase [Bacillus mangrovi]|uniref:SDR family NAD(P)-dependent oxidoreductase n=1 Tax=Metabacillus mangrovi TaxID=1491830 RepID=A0A7X2S361_9BACI|nr:SDR family oxidoreductase [Metabacillus mangrovi]MTH52537.1 SDR family NAD(P)-dependent oxidoreductase [Metabacillus mangrovi]
MKSIKGKTAIITGASSGIGEAVARKLASEGANVVLAARREDKIRELADELKGSYSAEVLAITTDVTSKQDVEDLVKQTKEAFGQVDILINNAGVMLLSFLKNDMVDQWEQMVDVNIKGVLFGVHSVLPGMLEKGTGHIVNISSVAGHEVMPSSAVYSATKYAVRALSMGMEKELADTPVRVTNISPGAVETELPSHITDEEVQDLFKDMLSGVKPLDSVDIAEAIYYALSQPDHVDVNEVIIRPVNQG